MSRPRADVTARLLLTLGALLPYWRFLTFSVIYVTDDRFTSDIFNGELPGRVIIGQLVQHWQWPLWTNKLCSGLPLGGAAADPLGLASFALLPPAPALDLMVIALVLIAAHGTYGLARRLGAERFGSVLAGLAFAGSGYIAAQLKHLGIVSTIAWLPVGLLLLDRMFDSPLVAGTAAGASEQPRPLWSRLSPALFGLVFGTQALAGFPQSAYICALVYGVFTCFRCAMEWRRSHSWRAVIGPAATIALATGLGAAMGAVVMLPLRELGLLSDRAEPLGWAWTTRWVYWPADFITFLIPYFNGDISNDSYAYVGKAIFWEDYGYVGAATVILALLCAMAWRRRPTVMFLTGMTITAYLLVLGPFTPVFRLAYDLVPGLALFRFPTRFLVVVDLGISVLGGLGLTFARLELTRISRPRSPLPLAAAAVVCLVTAADLAFHQPRQNPVVPARPWLAAPQIVGAILDHTDNPRTLSLGRYDAHERAFIEASGWSDVEPYFDLRDLLEPNVGGGYWNMPSADCYSGITPRWSVDVWGDHNRTGDLVQTLVKNDIAHRLIRFDPRLPTVLSTFGVTDVITEFPAVDQTLPAVARIGGAYLFRVDGARRVRIVSNAARTDTDADAAARLLDPTFDPNRVVLLQDDGSLGDFGRAVEPLTAKAVITAESATQVDIDSESSGDGYLVLADTYYPGWTATVDGQSTPVYRADISVRAIRIARGRHHVTFAYSSRSVATGFRVSMSACAVLVLWIAGAFYNDRRLTRRPLGRWASRVPAAT